MSELTIRPAYSMWPQYNRRLREVIGAMTDEQLAIRPTPERWPILGDAYHCAEVNQTLGKAQQLPQIDLGD